MWNSQTLKDLFGNQFQQATHLVSDATAKLSDPDLAKAETAIQTMLSNAQTAVDNAAQLLIDLEGSGIYAIAITPGVGSWISRFANAEGAPPLGGSVYSAMIVSIFVAPTLTPIANAYGQMKDTLTKPMRIDLPSLPALEKPALLDEGNADWLDEDVWKSQTVGDVFPAQLVSAKSAINAAQKSLTLAQNAKNAFDGRKAMLVEALADAQVVVTSMETTGIYSVLVPPGAGDWLTRLSSQTGAPPSDSYYFCAGTASVIQAADLSTVIASWSKLSGSLA